MFNLNREEAVLLLGGVSSPVLRKLKRRTLISFMPSFVVSRYSPRTEIRPVPLEIAIPESLGSMSSLGELKDPGLSAVLALVIERRIHPIIQRLLPRLHKVALTLSVAGFAYSLVSSSPVYQARRRRINLASLFWGVIAIYILSLSYRNFERGQDGELTRSKVRKILRFIHNQLFGGPGETSIPATPSTGVSSVRSEMSSPTNNETDIRAIYWELSVCAPPRYCNTT